jgi:hypothetical protein
MESRTIVAVLAISALVWLWRKARRASTRRPRKKTVFKLRSAREQRNPIDTVYNPKAFRRPRK